MNFVRLHCYWVLLVLGGCVALGAFAADVGTGSGWRAGVARVDITPDEPLWIAGYAARDRAAEGVIHPLWVKALALEDARGQRALLLTTDLIGFPRDMAETLLARIEATHGVAQSQVILSSSHTHSGPVVKNMLYDIYPLAAEDKALIEQYSEGLVDRILEAVDDALRELMPVRLEAANGVTRFAVNRRNNNESRITSTHDFKGPVDHAVPVLRVSREDDTMLAVLFGYACHATTLNHYEWSGDYPGFAQIELEKAYPETAAMFFTGCAGDQNPLPRRTVELAQQYGRELAAAVDRVLSEPMQPLEPVFRAAFTEVELALAPPPSRDELVALAEEGPGYRKRCARRLLETLDSGQALPTTYSYPIHFWQLGDQTIVALAGEVVVDYAIFLKRLLGHDTFVMAYAHHVPSYIPSERVLAEGGYEGLSSQILYGLPAPWAAGIEQRIMNEAAETAAGLGLPLSEWTEE
ncbi:MAG: neutral/alkaline non-lysosomal ceramidase N-terminal domain-containing protein [Candidatus Hydrogenedentota bacterium]